MADLSQKPKNWRPGFLTCGLTVDHFLSGGVIDGCRLFGTLARPRHGLVGFMLAPLSRLGWGIWKGIKRSSRGTADVRGLPALDTFAAIQ
jgi:hypothetical protein